MYEVELKVRAPHESVRERLAVLGADSRGTVRQTDTYYDAPHRSFAETDEALRLRHETHEERETAHLTYKGPLVEAASKTREERETRVADPDEMANILAGLGFTPAATVEKERERFACGEYVVALDTVAGLGAFVEVEREVPGSDAIEHARDGARDLLRGLDCDPDEQVRTSYLELLLDAADAAEPATDSNNSE